MKTDKASIIVIDEQNENNGNLPIESSNPKKKSTDSPAHDQFFKITQPFGLEAAILPIEKQMPIEDRSIKRERLASLRKQKNIETIVERTFDFCASKSIDKRTDLDWFNRYITLAENVSNKTMQDLWAKILAGELSRPGSYSLKALKVFRDMSIVDAKLLAKACSLAVKDQSKKNIRIISGTYQKPGLFNFLNKDRQRYINLSHFGLNYADILSLADNHLLYQQESESNMMINGEIINFNYNGVPLKLTAKKPNIALQFYKFTPIGTELARLISDKPNDDFFTILKQQLSHHFEISSG
ncbi:TIGR03899 family protein [Candidatus Colwellia aromaticivorans]|uniref:TIGR03899 family protein n=1 Tax=Candidatus Colwellia aromaticivorans TaxID=2267621 RepID=UPI000DF35315|nr:TIGR03899 family protein [Candidatus Colwellia aromaticivorans]